MKRLNHISAFFVLVTSLALLAGCSSGGGGGSSGGGSTGTDTTPPRVLSTTPANNATGVATDSLFSATFSEPIDSTSVTSANFYINGAAGNVSSKCSSAFLDPAGGLSPDTGYTVTIIGIKDSAGNALAAPYTGMFRTGPAFFAISAGTHHTTALKSDGTLWAWGNNDFGVLGDGTYIGKPAPAQIGTAFNWSAVSAGGGHTVALRSEGTLWAWGSNSNGQLGGVAETHKVTPTQIGTAANWRAVSAGGNYTLALKSDGTLWAWGSNSNGQLGDGTTIDRTTQTQIGSAADWSAISAGSIHTIALKSDGTLWAWGYNGYGELGDGTVVDKSSPTQIGTAVNWSAVSAGAYHTIALKSDGTLWTWGYNFYGQLGDGTTGNKTTPTQIGSAADWSALSAGGYHTLALKSDGTLWAWGLNVSGQLGDGTTLEKTSPARIGSAANWNAIDAGNWYTIALKSNGALWAVGYNFYGQLGDGTTTDKTTPAPVNQSSATTASAPSGVAATAGIERLTVSWGSVAGATSYDVYYSTSALVSTTTGTKLACATSPHILAGLTPDTAYYAIVVASNGYGDSAASSTATATPTGGFSLSAGKAGTGGGTVTSSPTGIDCGTTCSERFAANSSVTLTATPDAGSAFAGWSGACTGTGSCVITMDAAKTVTATFNSTGSSAAITADPGSVSMTASTCYPSFCTVSQTITITSSTPWTSTVPGFGSPGEGFIVSPDAGPAGSTPVTISYTSSVPVPADGFIRFRTTTIGVYVEVPVRVTVN